MAIGRFGPYVRHDGKFVSIPNGTAPAELSLSQAVELIHEKRKEEAQKIVRIFDEDPEVQILNGRYGIYICSHKTNYKIPRTVSDPASLSYDEVMAIVNSTEKVPAKTRRASSSKSRK